MDKHTEERRMATFGQYLHAMVADSGLSQKRVADAMGTDQAAVSRLMRDTNSPSIERARRYAEFLGGKIILIDSRGNEYELANPKE